MENMLTYIKEEKIILKNIIDNFENIDIKNFKSIGIIATGSSINAAFSCFYFLQDVLNKKIEIYEAYSFVNFNKRIDHDLYILISQSGESKSVIDAFNYLKEKENLKILAITNNINSSLAKKSNLFLNINVGVEKVGFVTKGFSGTLFNLILLGIHNSNEFNYINKFKEMLKNFDSLINKIENFVYENKKIFLETNRYSAISYSNLYGIAKEFETKFTETVRQASVAYELEAFMHGPYLECNKNHLIFFLNSNDNYLQRAKKLEKYLKNYVYDTVDFSIFIDNFEKYSNIELTIYYALIIQVLSYSVSKIKGIDLDKKIFEDFDEKLKSKIKE